MKNIRLIMSSVLTVAALTAGTSQAASAQASGVHAVNWGNVTIPGQLCQVKGWIRLHDGRAAVNHGSGYGVPLEVLTTTVTHGYLGHGLPVTALQVWCDTQSGTAAAEQAEGIMVFDSPGGRPHLLGTLTPQYHPSPAAHTPYQNHPNPAAHTPYVTVDRIDTAGHITVTELFYHPSNPDCCPSGRGHHLEVDRPHVHPRPHQDHDQIARSGPARTSPARQAWVSPSSPGPSVGSTLTRLRAAITR